MNQFLADEPVVAGLITMIGSLFGVLIVFGVQVDQAQKSAVLAFVGAAAWVAALVRARVTPNHKAVPAHV